MEDVPGEMIVHGFQLYAEDRLVVMPEDVECSIAKPRNPRHFDGIKGGRKRVSDTLVTKTVVHVRVKRSITTVSCTILASKHCLRRIFPRL